MIFIYDRFFNYTECQISQTFECIDYPSEVGYETSKAIENYQIRKSYSWPLSSSINAHIESKLNGIFKTDRSEYHSKLLMREIQGITYIRGGYFKNHSDNPNNNGRKLTGIILLNNPNEFNGGQLNIEYEGSFHPIDIQIGDLLLFDSTLIHNVTKIEYGIRKVIVFWLYNKCL